MLCLAIFGFAVLQGVEWYEEGEGGYSSDDTNGNLVPWNAGSFLNTNSINFYFINKLPYLW